MSADAERRVLDEWWAEFVATGRAPARLLPVHSRLIRSVHRGELPGGEVFVKTMTFPRGKDRLRYLLRALPAEHEAAMLARAAAAGLLCPEVVDVRTRRRFGLPHRSWLVTRALPLRLPPENGSAPAPLAEQAGLTMTMLAAGLVHRDLHGDNFARLDDGRLAVLDLQSASFRERDCTDRDSRLAAAARLVRDAAPAAARELLAGGLVTGEAELDVVVRRAARERAAYRRRRVLRCLTESTEFSLTRRWNGVEHRRREPRPPGRWIRGGRELRDCWVGERAACLFGSRSPLFWAFFRKWWWLGGGCALYVPQACREDRIERELALARSGLVLLDRQTQASEAEEDGIGTERLESGGRR